MARTHKRFFIPPCQSFAEPVFSPQKPWLAPLAGYSDLSFRLLCREAGAAVCETEMISAKGLLWESPGTSALLRSSGADTPLVVQLFGGEAESMGQAVLLLRRAGYSFFDCNMGCPVRKVMRQEAGAFLMDAPEAAIAIARAMLEAARAKGCGLPPQPAKIGFKLRLPSHLPVLWDLARRLEDLGAGWLTLHPRTARQGYTGHARHEATAGLAQIVTIPVMASGDMLTANHAHGILRETGAAGVMYARGALGNPLAFRDHAAIFSGGAPLPLTHMELGAMIKRHIALAKLHDGEQRAYVKMRSIIPRYVKGLRGVHELRQKLCQCSSWECLGQALDNFLAQANMS